MYSTYSAGSNCRTGTPLFLGIKFQVLRPYLMVVRLTKISKNFSCFSSVLLEVLKNHYKMHILKLGGTII